MKAQTFNVDIGSGTSSTDNSPIQRKNNYSASELLYLNTEINNAGQITGLGFYKASGLSTITIDSVYIYLKTTAAATVTANSSTAGYTLVYKGPFPNNITAGWVTVNFNVVNNFSYNTAAGNLAVLVVRPFQALTNSRPYYRYTNNVGNRNAWYKNDTNAWAGVMDEVSAWRPNIRLVFSPGCATPSAPTASNITANSAVLNWNQTGTPVLYQIKYGVQGFNVNTGGTSVFTATKPYTLNPPLSPATSYSYYVRSICSPGDTSVWSAVTDFSTMCSAPSITSKKDSFRCGPGAVTLEANASAGGNLKWYNTAAGGASLGNGTTFVTPSITTTTNYYVEAVQPSPVGQLGRNDYTGVNQVTPNNTGQGILFNALTDINMDSVAVWVVADAGSVTVQLQNAANAVIATNTFTFSGTGASATNRVKIYLPVNYSIPTGNNYKLLALSTTTVSLSREQNVNPPFSTYKIDNVITMVASWVNGSQNNSNYYYFYNFYVSTGCASPRQMVTATIRPLPVVNLGNDTTLCPGAALTFNTGNAGGSYLWSPGGQTTQTITVNAVGQYSVDVTMNGCSGKDTIVITPGIAPVNNLPDTVNLCEGSQTMLNAGNNGSTFSWTPGGATTQSINVNAGGVYSVVVKSVDGCRITDSTYVAMRPLPAGNLGSDTAICAQDRILLDAGNPGYSYAWNTGATSQVVNTADSGIYSVTVTSAYNCITMDSIHIAFKAEPRTEGFNFIPKFFEELGKVEFAPLNPTDVLSYEWDFGDGTPLVTTMNPTHVYTASGTYTVTLKVYNECTDFSRSQPINVDLPTGLVTLNKDDVQLSIYPNPAASVLNIQTGNQGYAMQEVMLFNAVGARVYHDKAASGSYHRLSVEHFTSGVYFVSILTDKGFVTQRVQIMR